MSKNSSTILKIENLTYQIKDQIILSDVTFSLGDKERLSIIGESGSGKSTLLRLINRLIEPTEGSVVFKNKNYKHIEPRRLRRSIGLLLQRPYLFPGTVADNLRFGPAQINEVVSDETIEKILTQVNLDGYANRKVANLSGGEAQRVSLARTLANSPQILMLDEPTSALDKKSQAQVEKLICKIAKEQNLPFILVTHDQNQAIRMTQAGILLAKGQIKARGKVEEVINVS